MTTSMIKGNPLKLMLQFAFPLLLGNLLQQTYNIIDAAIVGQILGAKALASVGASSSIQFLVLGFCMGSCTGFGVPVAKYFGAEKIEKMRDYIFNGAVLCAGIAVILTALCSVLCPQILHILSVPEDIYDNAYSYLLIIFLGIPFTILYNYLSSILRSVGDSRTPFIFLALSAVLNIFLDLFCIVVLKLGCAGAAIATISAQAISIKMDVLRDYNYADNHMPVQVNQTCSLYGIVRDSFMTFYKGCLYVGCFNKYTESTIARYAVDSKGDLVNTFNEELGMMFEMAVPLDYSTISEQAQGMAFYNDKLLLSHSFGILPSRIVFYEQSDKRLYVNENSARSYRMPEMIEQIVVEGDELYVLFESGAYAYRGYAGNVVDRVLKLNLIKMEESYQEEY